MDLENMSMRQQSDDITNNTRYLQVTMQYSTKLTRQMSN